MDDGVFEGNEMFYVTLERASDRDRNNIILHPVNGTIYIIDIECEYVSMYDRQLCYICPVISCVQGNIPLNIANF